MAEAIKKSELAELFGSTDLLEIIGIKNLEAYKKFLDDGNVNPIRLSYLKCFLKTHPSSSGLTPDSHESIKEIVKRSKMLYVMDDIYNFLIQTGQISKECENYLLNGSLPDLKSLKYLRTNTFKGDERDFEVPEFETIASELKTLMLSEIKRIRETQEADLAEGR